MDDDDDDDDGEGSVKNPFATLHSNRLRGLCAPLGLKKFSPEYVIDCSCEIIQPPNGEKNLVI